MYDPKTKVWTQGKAMQCKRSAVGVAALNDRVYICGGYDGITSLSTVECYCPKTDSWSTVSIRSSDLFRNALNQVDCCANEICFFSVGGTDDEIPFSRRCY